MKIIPGHSHNGRRNSRLTEHLDGLLCGEGGLILFLRFRAVRAFDNEEGM